jgi:hypothetical protein
MLPGPACSAAIPATQVRKNGVASRRLHAEPGRARVVSRDGRELCAQNLPARR